eukprot:184485_1
MGKQKHSTPKQNLKPHESRAQKILNRMLKCDKHTCNIMRYTMQYSTSKQNDIMNAEQHDKFYGTVSDSKANDSNEKELQRYHMIPHKAAKKLIQSVQGLQHP